MESGLRIGVMCGASEKCPDHYKDLAKDVGRILAKAGHAIVYGGGRAGLMGQVSDEALAYGAKVYGIIPRFMCDVEWHREDITELQITSTMAERKAQMFAMADGILFLPGGTGTMEELFEALSAKKLGLLEAPLILLNHRGFYDSLIHLMKTMVEESFLDGTDAGLWEIVESPEEIVSVLQKESTWKRPAPITERAESVFAGRNKASNSVPNATKQ